MWIPLSLLYIIFILKIMSIFVPLLYMTSTNTNMVLSFNIFPIDIPNRYSHRYSLGPMVYHHSHLNSSGFRHRKVHFLPPAAAAARTSPPNSAAPCSRHRRRRWRNRGPQSDWCDEAQRKPRLLESTEFFAEMGWRCQRMVYTPPNLWRFMV